jgi:energy-coupling factor transporter transmembrane protein EcfT
MYTPVRMAGGDKGEVDDEDDEESYDMADDEDEDVDGDDEGEEGETKEHPPPPLQPMGWVDWLLLALAAAMLGLFMLIARQVAVAVGVAMICISICAYAWVSAQARTGLARWLSLIVCGLSITAFLFWSFKYVFYMPKAKANNGCGGVFFQNLDNDMSKPKRHDEL